MAEGRQEQRTAVRLDQNTNAKHHVDSYIPRTLGCGAHASAPALLLFWGDRLGAETKYVSCLLTRMNRDAEEAKRVEAARKKAEKDALRAQEEAELPSRGEPKNKKAPAKKARGLDLSQLDDNGDSSASALNATGIDNALDALSLTTGGDDSKVDRHPERRYPAAYAKYEERRLEEMKKDGSGVGLRLEQRKNRIRKEFEKHPDNPFNQASAAYNASRGDIADIKAAERTKIESRLGK